jgi:hypothetical protein
MLLYLSFHDMQVVAGHVAQCIVVFIKLLGSNIYQSDALALLDVLIGYPVVVIACIKFAIWRNELQSKQQQQERNNASSVNLSKASQVSDCVHILQQL